MGLFDVVFGLEGSPTHQGDLQVSRGAWLCLRLWTTKIKGSIGAQNKRRVESTWWIPKLFRGSWLPPKKRWGSDGWAIYLSGAASAPPFLNWAFKPHSMKEKMQMHISHQFLCADVLYRTEIWWNFPICGCFRSYLPPRNQFLGLSWNESVLLFRLINAPTV